MGTNLYSANTPDRFWKLFLEPQPDLEEWSKAARAAAPVLPPTATRGGDDLERLLAAVLGEGQFGPDHWRISWAKRIYYELKPLMPRRMIVALRQRYHRRRNRPDEMLLDWPVEQRFVRFQLDCLAALLRGRGHDSVPYLRFWPEGHSFALVLTHDIEDAPGQAFVGAVADLEERHGFRSAFNFVAERYPVDQGLLRDLRARGFEVGVHGLKHDGKLFSSRRRFEARARRINHYLRDWDASGFRSPLTHRNPEWMQALAVEYDTSFFDTDPFEPMAGGTMSIWPFQVGHFVELPYTLVQDHTLLTILGERTPALWLEKVEFLARWHGMALVNAHPDYLLQGEGLAVYEAFLRAMRERADYWHALPRAVARWWRRRAEFAPSQESDLSTLPGATPGYLCLTGDAVEFQASAMPRRDGEPARAGGTT